MEYRIEAARILTSQGWLENQIITINEGIIESIVDWKPEDIYDEQIPYLTPGVIDNHLHGGDGYEILEGDEEKMEAWLVRLAENGVAAILSGPHTDSNEAFQRTLAATKNIMTKQSVNQAEGALLLGAHLEGPFISPVRPGAMKKERIQKPTVENYKRLVEGYEAIIREVSMAPEEDEQFELIQYLKEQCIRVLAGHTNCDYETAQEAFAAGVSGICHTFNAARPVNHRDPGILTAALDHDDIYCEFIGDHVHLHPGIIKLIYRCKGAGRMMLISDAVSTTNLPEGIHGERGREVEIKNGKTTLLGTDTIAGSAIYGTYSVRKLVESGISLEEVMKMATQTPAQWLGLRDWTIQAGNRAILSFWNVEYEPEGTWILQKRYKK